MEIVAPTKLEQQVCRDIDDDWVLATALAGKAQCIATGDKDLLAIATFENIDKVPSQRRRDSSSIFKNRS